MKAVLNENLNSPKSWRNWVWFLWVEHFCFKEFCFNESCWQWFLWQLSITSRCRSVVSWYIAIQCPKSFVFYIHQLKFRTPKTVFGNLDPLNLSLGTCLGCMKLRSHIIGANILIGVIKMDDAFKTYILKSNHFNSRWRSALPSLSTRLRILIIDFLYFVLFKVIDTLWYISFSWYILSQYFLYTRISALFNEIQNANINCDSQN